MKEYKVGEQIVLEIQEANDCSRCFFSDKLHKGPGCTCYNDRSFCCSCLPEEREDGKSIIFVEKKRNESNRT